MSKTEITPGKAEQMVEYLQECIHTGTLKPGEKLPPLRELREKFGISLGTAKRGIDYLCEKGLLESSHGSGTFVKRSSSTGTLNPEHRLIALMPWQNHQIGVLPTIYSGLLETCTANNTQLILSHMNLNEFDNSHIRQLANGYSALILLGEYDISAINQLTINMPVICCGIHHNFAGGASIFDMDPYQSAELAVTYFSQKKINHVKCYTGSSPAAIKRLLEFQQQWQLGGGSVEFHQFADNADAAKADFAPDGAFLFSSGWLMNLFCKRTLETFGRKLTETATILGFDGRCCLDPYFEQAPTIYTDWKVIGQDMFYETIRRINSPGSSPRRCYYPVKLVTPTT